jgi:hypothetical protein
MHKRLFFTQSLRRCHQALLANYLACTDGPEELDQDTADRLAITACQLAETLTNQWVYGMRVDQAQDASITDAWRQHSTTDLHSAFTLPDNVCPDCGGDIQGEAHTEPVAPAPVTSNGTQTLVQ